jgi:hypothetical protein
MVESFPYGKAPLFFLLERELVSGLTSGAVKG